MEISNELRKLVDPNNECCCANCLSNKCKDWARVQSYYIGSTPLKIKYNSWISGIAEADFIADTEPEAIFQACDYILNELTK